MTDDPGMFGTTSNKEYVRAATTFGFTTSELTELVRNGIRAVFCDEDVRADLFAELDG